MISDPEDWDKMVENNEDTQSLFEIKVVGQKFHISGHSKTVKRAFFANFFAVLIKMI